MPVKFTVKKIIFGLVLSVLFLIFPQSAVAKDYTIDKVNIVAEITPEGSANITETRTYNLSGSFSWADEWIPKDEYRITNYKLWEGSSKYKQDDSGSAGTYSVNDEGDRVYIHDKRKNDLGKILSFWSKKLLIDYNEIRVSWKHNNVSKKRFNPDYVGQMGVSVVRYPYFLEKLLAISDIILAKYQKI